MNGATSSEDQRRVGRCCNVLWALALTMGCSGEIGGLGESGGSGSPGPGSGSGTGVGVTPARAPEEAGYTEENAEGLYDRPAPAARVARLTHIEWENSVRDLLGLDSSTAFASDFRIDPTQQGFLFDNDATTLSVDDALWGAYQRAAVSVAALVTGNATQLGALLPADSGDARERARAFIVEFGERAHRRPLSDAEVEEYLALYDSAVGAYLGLTDFDSGIRLLIEAFLQSPNFLYRIESSTTQVGEVIPLDAWEVASRLSYMLWDSMPDETLFAAAQSGELARADVATEQAIRMLDDPRAEPVIAHFHEQLLERERYTTISPAAAFFPDASPELADFAATENDRFVRHIFESGGGYRDLLTSNVTFVNAELASIYGVTGSFDDTFVQVNLDAAQRKGVLTQVGFLASHATSVNPDPIHRGVFVAKRILCAHIAAPPADIPPLPPPEGRTNRETIEDHTQQEGSVCASCHATIINPLGFPFENYDAVGGYRTTDNGLPVDATSSPAIDGQSVPVQNALGLIDAIAGSTAAHDCYAEHWLEFSYGRPRTDIDLNLVQRLGEGSVQGGLTIKDLIIGLVMTESFMTRSAEELP